MNNLKVGTLRICAIAAVAENGVIGNNGSIPWSLPEDMKHFRSTTLGHPIIMGRKTWDSLVRKPLPHRRNMVLTSSPQSILSSYQGVEAYDSIDALLGVLSQSAEMAYCIGGEQVYRALLPYTSELCISHIPGVVKGDAYFPVSDFSQWNLIGETQHPGFVVRRYD